LLLAARLAIKPEAPMAIAASGVPVELFKYA
jgi:hypothetical protein